VNKRTKTIIILAVFLASLALLSVPGLALTEDEVKTKVAETSKEAVSGNVFIWFLCAIAFLKVSQKIDSFMSSLGINVGHTGGNMMAEALVAARSVSMGKQALSGGGFDGGGFRAGRGNSGSGGGGNAGGGRFLSGGLAGAVSRKFTSSAISSATNQGGNAITRNAFQSSMAKGGNFANNIISSVARGNINQMGSITGTTANNALTSYMGEVGKADAPAYTNVEIGGGRIMGMETTADNPGGIGFGMYNTEQYMAPEKGGYETVTSADGAKWYKQYAESVPERTSHDAGDGGAATQKLPPMPRRKDRV